VPPLIVFILGEFLCDGLASRFVKELPVNECAAQLSITTTYLEAAGRMRMLATLLLLLGVATGTIVYFICEMRRTFDVDTLGIIALAFLVLSVLGVSVNVVGKSMDFLRDTGDILGPQFFKDALNLSATLGGPHERWLETVIFLIQGLTIPMVLAAVAVVLGLVSCVALKDDGRSASANSAPMKRVSAISSQMKRASLYLYVGSGLLVSGILFEYGWTHWLGFFSV